ncbi:class I SAM-dependent methyltransferase [Actinoplanes sp. LDG1-06]|uniref:Class I SAM-dependent methyltransferase n=1 Tax=Paractinoplanes ovalisporus TaxID=2810368 RepID=A0ABS2A275_9ACTN|nr:class I SAM-dependent methyltransferase [Actinoplanes ovalisporus]MBM2613947.1 class I SAM-dependent methyltransferase [Actinoplanes ovalisporus]
MANLGLVFNDVPELYERARPGYPDALFDDLSAITGLGAGAKVVEVGAGTGQATRSLARLGCAVTALEPGPDLAAALARKQLPDVDVLNTTFEEWQAGAGGFDAVVAASSWHWVDPAVGWRKAYDVLRPGGWLALLGHVVVRREGEPENYAETADLHERYSPGNPVWGHPPLEEEARGSDQSLDPRFGPAIVRWYPTAQEFDGAGFADHLRTLSPYRSLPADVREPLLDAVAERIRTRLGDRVTRRYLTVLRLGQRGED